MEALGTLLASVSGAVIWSIAVLMALDRFGLNLGPLLAGAGVVGVAVGFGAQTLVRDLLSGVFMLIEDLSEVIALIQVVADGLANNPDWKDRILSRPEVWGVERFDADAVAIRTVITTRPLEQWAVSRELRRRLKAAFDEAGIEIPFPQRTVWVRSSTLSSNRHPPE